MYIFWVIARQYIVFLSYRHYYKRTIKKHQNIYCFCCLKIKLYLCIVRRGNKNWKFPIMIEKNVKNY